MAFEEAGGVAQAAVQLMQYVIGTNTTTSSNNTTATSSNLNATTNVTSNDVTSTNSDVNTASNSSTNTSQTTTSQNTTDPGVVASMKSLAQAAITNSTNPAATQGLMTSFIQNATDAMTAVFGTAQQAGVYNSSSANVQNNDILSRATADAAQAVLNYQTSEQGIADTTLNQLGQLLSGNTTTTNTASNTSSDVNQQTASTTDENDSATTSVNEVGSSTSKQAASSSSNTGMSVICTWMYENNRMQMRDYIFSFDYDFKRLSILRASSYVYGAKPLVRHLEKTRGTSWFSLLIMWLMTQRTKYVLSFFPHLRYKRTWKGRFASWIVTSFVFVAGVILLVNCTIHNYKLIRNYRRKMAHA
jgi:hypothetical protein